MKVVLVTTNTHGGMIHYTSQLANSLSTLANLNVVVIGPIGLDRSLFSPFVKIIETHMGNVAANFIQNMVFFWRPLKLVRIIQEEAPDVVHCNGNHIWLSFLLTLIPKYPVITTIHDSHAHLGSRKIDQCISRRMQTDLSDAVIVHGQRSKSEMGTKTVCHVLPIGDSTFLADLSQGHQIPEEENTLLFFGRIEKYKGLGVLMDSLSILKHEFPDIRLIIAGDGDISQFHELTSKNDNIEIHNRYILDSEIPSYFMRASIIVLPYLEATQSGIVPIAYAFAKPVIITDVGDLKEVVEQEKTGLVIPPGDPVALADAVSRLLSNKAKRTAFGQNGHKKMITENSWRTIAERTLAIYQTVIKERD